MFETLTHDKASRSLDEYATYYDKEWAMVRPCNPRKTTYAAPPHGLLPSQIAAYLAKNK